MEGKRVRQSVKDSRRIFFKPEKVYMVANPSRVTLSSSISYSPSPK